MPLALGFVIIPKFHHLHIRIIFFYHLLIMDRFIPSLLCCLHYRLESNPLQPFATTLYLATRRWEWVIYPSELNLVIDLYNTLRMLPRRLRQFLEYKTRPGNEFDQSHDFLIRAVCTLLRRIVERPRVQPEWPLFLLSSQFPLREFPFALDRGVSCQSLKQAILTLTSFLELIVIVTCLRVPTPAIQRLLETCMKISRDIVIMLSFYQRFAHETFYYLMLRGADSRQEIENEQLLYAIRRLQSEVDHFALFQI